MGRGKSALHSEVLPLFYGTKKRELVPLWLPASLRQHGVGHSAYMSQSPRC